MSKEHELKPCPFCGGTLKLIRDGVDFNGNIFKQARHPCIGEGNHCPLSLLIFSIDKFNTRPIEATKEARIADLEQQLTEAKRANLQQRVGDICEYFNGAKTDSEYFDHFDHLAIQLGASRDIAEGLYDMIVVDGCIKYDQYDLITVYWIADLIKLVNVAAVIVLRCGGSA
jgi:hypothetical protein